jgi:sugar phosphate isomerase/epimerase
MESHNRILERVSYHAVYDNSILDALIWAGQNGFAGIQVAVEAPHLAPPSLTKLERKEIAQYCDENNLHLVLHAHDNTASLFETDLNLLSGIRVYYSRLLEVAAELGACIVTVHPGTPPTYRTGDDLSTVYPAQDRAHWQEAGAANLSWLTNLSGHEVVLCIENQDFNELTRSVIEPFLEAGSVSLCWDIAKAPGAPDRSLASFSERHLRSIRQVHLHDIDDDGRSHCVIGSGKLDFRSFLAQLPGCDILDCCIEVRPRELAKESLAYLRQIVQST